MADVKPINMHKRIAAGEKVTGMKKGGAVKSTRIKSDKKFIMKKGSSRGC